MAYINHDVSTMAMPSGMNRMGQFPLDMSSVYYDEASLKAYAESGSIAYVGQIVSLVDETNNKVTVYSIQDKAGTLKEVGTVPTGDEKTIDVDANGKITLANIESLVFERDVTDENGDVVKENVQYQALLTKDGLVWVEPSKTTVEGLATLIDALTKRVENIEKNYKTKQEAYTAEGSTIKTVTKVEQNANGEVNITFEDIAFPEDKDTTYSVKEGEKILSLDGTEFSTTLKIVHENNYIKLLGVNDEEISSFDASAFVADGVLEDVSYNEETKDLTFTWNIVTGEDENKNPIYKTDTINIADLIDTYEAGKGLALNSKKFEVIIDPASQDNLTVSETGLKLSGVKTLQEEISSPATNGTSVEFIDTISQNANGEITATKKKVNFPSLYYNEIEGLVLGDSKIALQSEQLYFEYGKDESGSVNSSGNALAISVGNIGTENLSSDLANTIQTIGETATDAQSRVAIVEGKIDEITSVGGEPNVIEKITVNGGPVLSIENKTVDIEVPTNFSDLNDDSGFDARITAAQSKAEEAANAAGTNATAIQTLGTNLDTANGKITALETAKEDHATRITNLETKTSGHDTTIASHTQSITELTSGISTKAEQAALDGAIARIAANESAITTLNDTTIVNINKAIATKADASVLDNYYTKTQIGTIEEGKTLVEMIAAAGDKTALENRVKAIEDDYLTEADKTELSGLINGHEERIVEMEKFWAAADDPTGTIDKLAEIVDYINKDTTGAIDMAADIQKNADDIAALTKTVGDNKTAVDEALATFKVKDVDNTTLKLDNGVASVKAVSTDLLTQGSEELILKAGGAGIKAAE